MTTNAAPRGGIPIVRSVALVKHYLEDTTKDALNSFPHVLEFLFIVSKKNLFIVKIREV
jgi:hypothetical protein